MVLLSAPLEAADVVPCPLVVEALAPGTPPGPPIISGGGPPGPPPRVGVGSRDEIGQLALTFNAMSAEVARSNQLRRQMTADIAHDLRTPLTVIAGYIESRNPGAGYGERNCT